MKSLVFAMVLTTLSACSGSPPPATRYYALAAPAASAAPVAEPSGEGVLVVEPLATAAAYDDERIVYRTSPYRLDYYEYHRWTSAPGSLVAGYLAAALRATGKFQSVTTEDRDRAIFVSGRVLALEEVDSAPKQWQGHIVVDLTAREPSGKIVWSTQLDLTEPMLAQSPEGLARAITAALAKAAPNLASPLAAICDREARATRAKATETSRR